MRFPKTSEHEAFTTFVPAWSVLEVIARAVETGYQESEIKIWKCDPESNPQIAEFKKITSKIRRGRSH